MSNDEKMLLALSCEYCENLDFVRLSSNLVPETGISVLCPAVHLSLLVK